MNKRKMLIQGVVCHGFDFRESREGYTLTEKLDKLDTKIKLNLFNWHASTIYIQLLQLGVVHKCKTLAWFGLVAENGGACHSPIT